MMTRLGPPICLVLAALAAGCAGEAAPSAPQPSLYHLGAATLDADMEPMPSVRRTFGKPLSSRVLAAIAFERATGLKAYPDRLVDSD